MPARPREHEHSSSRHLRYTVFTYYEAYKNAKSAIFLVLTTHYGKTKNNFQIEKSIKLWVFHALADPSPKRSGRHPADHDPWPKPETGNPTSARSAMSEIALRATRPAKPLNGIQATPPSTHLRSALGGLFTGLLAAFPNWCLAQTCNFAKTGALRPRTAAFPSP